MHKAVTQTNAGRTTGLLGKKVRFAGVDWEEEGRRTARGVESRRERKECREISRMTDKNRQKRVEAVLEKVLHHGGRAASLCALSRGVKKVRVQLNLFLDDFVGEDEDLAQRLTDFHAIPLSNIHQNMTEELENILYTLSSNGSFFNTFRAYIPSTVVSSSDEDDSPTSKNRRQRKRHLETNCSQFRREKKIVLRDD